MAVFGKGFFLLIGCICDDGADATGGFKQHGGFTANDFQILIFLQVDVAFSHQLVNFSLGHVFSEFRQNLDNSEPAGAG